jgi:hypothetical protein
MKDSPRTNYELKKMDALQNNLHYPVTPKSVGSDGNVKHNPDVNRKPKLQATKESGMHDKRSFKGSIDEMDESEEESAESQQRDPPTKDSKEGRLISFALPPN